MAKPRKYRAYSIEVPTVIVPPEPLILSSAPTTSTKNALPGQLGINESSSGVFDIYVFGGKNSSGNAQWARMPGTDNEMGDLTLTGDLTLSGAAKKITLTGGAATDFIGQATLSSGSATVSNTNVTANDRIFLSYEGGSISNSGQLSYTINAGTSFTIESTNASDANTVSYFIVREA